MRNSKSAQAGFTLIELIVVIVILGILAAVALPKFVDLKSSAKTSAASGIAGALASGTTVNFAAAMAGNTGSIQVCATPGCAAIANSLLIGGTVQYSASWTFSGSVNCGASVGTTGACSITSSQAPATSTTATIVCTG